MPDIMASHPPVLIIDDDSNGNLVVADHLRFRGFTPTSMYSGQAALDYLMKLSDDELPRVILLDVLMPGMNGCQVLTEIRRVARMQNIPIVLLSILSQDEVKEQISCGCNGYTNYVNKPFEMRDVVKILEGLICA
jgi:two-component system alkaline phosphatase synthesis response regulator PhoP